MQRRRPVSPQGCPCWRCLCPSAGKHGHLLLQAGLFRTHVALEQSSWLTSPSAQKGWDRSLRAGMRCAVSARRRASATAAATAACRPMEDCCLELSGGICLCTYRFAGAESCNGHLLTGLCHWLSSWLPTAAPIGLQQVLHCVCVLPADAHPATSSHEQRADCALGCSRPIGASDSKTSLIYV